jgi:hypothetical protein
MQMTQEDRKILRDAADIINHRKKTERQIADENKAKNEGGAASEIPAHREDFRRAGYLGCSALARDQRSRTPSLIPQHGRY